MSAAAWKWTRGSIIALVVVSVLWWVWPLRARVTDHCAPDHEHYVAEYGETDLPQSAKNIHIVFAGIGLGGRAVVRRFEAPIEDATAYALTEYARFGPVPGDQGKTIEFVPILGQFGRHDFSPFGMGDLSWFDIAAVRKGITLPRDHANRPLIVIDTERGICYSEWTD